MNTAFFWLVQNSIAAALMLPVVLLACRLCRHRPAVQHLLWLIVLLKFVTPPIVVWPWSLADLRDAVWHAEEAPAEISTVPADLPPLDLAVISLPINEQPSFLTIWTPYLLPTALTIWLGGATLCAVVQARRIFRHAKLVHRGNEAPAALIANVRAVAQQMCVRPPRALVARGIDSPFIWCLGYVRLMWPQLLSSGRELARSQGVIAHELAHLRRRDHVVAWIELAAGIVWWWNPLFWFVRRRLRESAEMACDALAIGTCPARRKEYAEMLLDLSAGFKPGMPAPVLAVSAGTPSSFERRLSMILSERVSGKLSWSGVATACALALLLLPAWSLAQQTPKPAAIVADIDEQVRQAMESRNVATDAELLQLIEAGKFDEAKARLHVLKAKQAADAAIAKGVFPDKWKEALLKDLPDACKKEIEAERPLAWASCKNCHVLPWPEKDVRNYWQMKDAFNRIGEKDAEVHEAHARWAAATAKAARDQAAQRHFVLIVQGEAPTLIANNNTGKILWQTRFADSLEGRSKDDRWSVQETKDGKAIVLTWVRKEDRVQYTIDAVTGKIMQVINIGNPDSGANDSNSHSKAVRLWLDEKYPNDPEAGHARWSVEVEEKNPNSPANKLDPRTRQGGAETPTMPSQKPSRELLSEWLKAAENPNATEATKRAVEYLQGSDGRVPSNYKWDPRSKQWHVEEVKPKTKPQAANDPNAVRPNGSSAEQKYREGIIQRYEEAFRSATEAAARKDLDEAARQQVENNRRAAEEKLAEAQSEYARARDLAKKGYKAASDAQLEAVQAQLRAAEADVRQLQDQISAAKDKATIERENAERDYLRLAQSMAEDGKSDTDLVKALYRAAAKRDPSEAELEFCLYYLSGMSKNREGAIVKILQLIQSTVPSR